MPKQDQTHSESKPTTPDDAPLLRLRPPVDVMAVLPLIIDALDEATAVYVALDLETPGCCMPNQVLAGSLAKIEGLLARATLHYVDIEAARLLLQQAKEQQEAEARALLTDLNGHNRPEPEAETPPC